MCQLVQRDICKLDCRHFTAQSKYDSGLHLLVTTAWMTRGLANIATAASPSAEVQQIRSEFMDKENIESRVIAAQEHVTLKNGF